MLSICITLLVNMKKLVLDIIIINKPIFLIIQPFIHNTPQKVYILSS